MKKITILLLFALTIGQLKAQLEVDGQIRPRYELRDGYKKLKSEGDEPTHYISQRTRLRFGYKLDNLEMKISFQDVHEWGAVAPKKMESGIVGMHEGWVKLRKNDLFLQIGRQEIQYDNGRLLSASNWNQVGFTHDAVKMGLKTDKLNIETAIAYNNNEGATGTPYELMNTIWLSYKTKNLTASLLNLADVRQPNDSTDVDYLRNTVGPIVKYKSDMLDAEARTFYQFGKMANGTDVSAYYVNADVKYKLNKKFNVTAGFEYKSGHSALDTLSTTSGAFDIMYGARHKFNGLIDYFNVPSTTGNSGLVDVYGKVGVSPAKKVSLEAQYHYFHLPTHYIHNGVIMDGLLGSELDLIAKIKFSKVVQLYLSYSTIFGTETLEAMKGGDKDQFTSYATAMLTIKPSLFKSEKK